MKKDSPIPLAKKGYKNNDIKIFRFNCFSLISKHERSISPSSFEGQLSDIAVKCLCYVNPVWPLFVLGSVWVMTVAAVTLVVLDKSKFRFSVNRRITWCKFSL